MPKVTNMAAAEIPAEEAKRFLVTEEDFVELVAEVLQCNYCEQVVGEYHRDDCPMITKNVRVHLNINYTTWMPAHWNEKDIKFHYNAKNLDIMNLIDEIMEIQETRGCACEQVTFQHVEYEDGTHA